MANPSYSGANVAPSTDTFAEWLDLTNRIAYDMLTTVVTAEANTKGACTEANAYMTGVFAANTLIVGTELRGALGSNLDVSGTGSPSANLNITSNVVHSGTTFFGNANAQFAANVSISGGANVYIQTTEFRSNAVTSVFDGTAVVVNANTDINGANLNIDTTKISIQSANVIAAGAGEVSFDYPLVRFIGANVYITNNVTIGDAAGDLLNVIATSQFDGDTTFNGNTVIGSAATDQLDVVANTDFLNDVQIGSDGSDELLVQANAGFTANVAMSGALVNITSVNTAIGDANTDVLNVGANAVFNDKIWTNNEANLASATIRDLTATRVPYVGTGGSITDEAGFEYHEANNTLAVANIESTGYITTANTLTAKDLAVTNSATITADLQVDGGATLGNANGDNIAINGQVTATLKPNANGVLLGNTISRWTINAQDIDASANVDVGVDLNVAGSADIVGSANVQTNANVGGTLGVVGVATFSDVTQPNANGVDLGATTRRWDMFANNVNVLDRIDVDNSGQVNTFDLAIRNEIVSNVTINGAYDLTVNGNTVLGSAAADKVTINALAELNGTMNVASNAQIGWGTANGGGSFSQLTVAANSTHANVAISNNALATEYTTNGANVNISVDMLQGEWQMSLLANSLGQVLQPEVVFTDGKITAADLLITNTAILPGGTSISAQDLSANLLTVFLQSNLEGNVFLGTTSGAGAGEANVITANAYFISTIKPFSNTVSGDLGQTTRRFGGMYASGPINLANTTGNTVISVVSTAVTNSTANTQIAPGQVYASNSSSNTQIEPGILDIANTTSNTVIDRGTITCDNVYARGDLIGNFQSDIALKEELTPLDHALQLVDNLNGYQYKWRPEVGDFREGTVDYGVIAQDLEKVLPHAVSTNTRGYKSIRYNAIIPLLIEAVKELNTKVNSLSDSED